MVLVTDVRSDLRTPVQTDRVEVGGLGSRVRVSGPRTPGRVMSVEVVSGDP